jgi:hypothetical protein
MREQTQKSFKPLGQEEQRIYNLYLGMFTRKYFMVASKSKVRSSLRAIINSAKDTLQKIHDLLNHTANYLLRNIVGKQGILKVPSHQIRLALKWCGWIDFHEYKNRGW